MEQTEERRGERDLQCHGQGYQRRVVTGIDEESLVITGRPVPMVLIDRIEVALDRSEQRARRAPKEQIQVDSLTRREREGILYLCLSPPIVAYAISTNSWAERVSNSSISSCR